MMGGKSIVIVGLVLAGACAHTKSTDDGTEKKAEQGGEEKAGKSGPVSPGPGSRGSELHPGDKKAVPVATSPKALLAPGADDEIRERLEAEGFLAADAKPSDAAMREGLRRFQRAKDLPATGTPDHETVKRLGLDPDKTFRQGTVKD
jgi:hypothetical protein